MFGCLFQVCFLMYEAKIRVHVFFSNVTNRKYDSRLSVTFWESDPVAAGFGHDVFNKTKEIIPELF